MKKSMAALLVLLSRKALKNYSIVQHLNKKASVTIVGRVGIKT
jgi:hypothetical protein